MAASRQGCREGSRNRLVSLRPCLLTAMGGRGGLKGGLTNFLYRAIAGNQQNETQGKSKGIARAIYIHQTYFSKIMIIAYLR